MENTLAHLFCKRIEESGRDCRWGIGRASRYLRGLGVDGELLKNAESKLVYCDPKSVIRTGESIAYEVTDQHIEVGNGKTAQIVRPLRVKAKQPTEGAVMQFTSTLTSVSRDRDGDVLEPKGAKVDLLGPLLWNHFPGDPIGKMLRIVKQNTKQLVMEFAIADTPLGRDIAQLVEFGALRRMSHGFIPEKYEEMSKDGSFVGWHVHEYEVLEASVVSVASNRDAVITAMSRGKLAHPLVKGWAGKMFDDRPVVVPAVTFDTSDQHLLTRQAGTSRKPFTKSSSSTFDVWREHLEPASLEYDWVSRYIGCQVKHLFWVHTAVPKARIGSWLTGLRKILGDYTVEDTRHISSGGEELPPKYEIIQLTPEKSNDFLVQGMEFRCGPERKFVVGFEPYWGALEVTFYTSNEDHHKQFARETIDKAWDWSRKNNFLKGQAFSLTGGFLDKTDETWEGLFLPDRNKAPVCRAVSAINEKRAKAPNRGMILAGPPGTGKTLSARIMRNQAMATFIWVAARDFWHAGTFGGITGAFDLAKELAPSIVCFEDVDSWIGSYGSEDLLKSEMDGMGRSSGVLTLLTTNFPERIPDALIDRPGRFHDVLMFDLPDLKSRLAMLAAWIPDAPERDRRKAADRTNGYSGAHIYELAQYAKTIHEEGEASLGESLIKAVEKIEEQRELINGIQLEGSHYRPQRSAAHFTNAFVFGNKAEGDADGETQTKGTVPGNPAGGSGEGEDGEWSKPNLSDFTDKSWDDCSMMEKNGIAKHFAWYSDLDSFGSLSLPHHFPDSGKPSLNGVRNALARAGQVQGIGGDIEKVRAHLQAHMPKEADGEGKCVLLGEVSVGLDSEAKQLLAELKSGRTLSKANEASIRDAKADCDEIAGFDNLPRAAKALATRASKSLDSVLESAAQQEDEQQPKQAAPVDKTPSIAVMVAKAVSGAIRRAKG